MATISDSEVPDRSDLIQRITITFIVLPVIAVIGRFWSRWIAQNSPFGMDDVFCLVALVLSVTFSTVVNIWGHHGLGWHVDNVSSVDIELGFKLNFAGYYLFNTSLGTVKFSALFFYRRVFERHSRRFNIGMLCAHLATMGWLASLIVSITLQCYPIQRLWKPDSPGHCFNTGAWYLAFSIFNALLDVYILILPMPMLFRLKMSVQRRFLLAGAFLCGYSCLITSLGRLAVVTIIGDGLNSDFTWHSLDVFCWAVIDPAFGIISICLPSWFALIKHATNNGLASLFVSAPAASRMVANHVTNGHSHSRHATISFARLSDDGDS